MASRIDRMIHLLLRERLGNQGPPDLSCSILDAIDNKPARHAAPQHQLPVAPRAYKPWMALAAGIAICAAVVLAISAWLITRPSEVSPVTAHENRVRVIPSEQETANSADPESGEPKSNAKPGSSMQEPGPALPDQVKQPEPEPKPELPKTPSPEKDPVVEQPPGSEPQPTPPGPVEEPTPAPGKDPVKDPVVETPAPEPEPERPPSETQPKKPVALGSVLYAPEKSRLEMRKSDEDKWQAWQDADEVVSGLQLKARRPVAIQLDDGARLYFDGEIKLSGDQEKLTVTVEDESVYFDVYGSKREFTVTRGDALLSFSDAELLAEKSGLRLQVSCLGGEIARGDVTLRAGWTASLSEKGLSREKFQGDRGRHNPLVASMDQAFVLMREELSPDAGNRVYHGEWKDDVVRGAGKELAFGIELSEDIELKERAYLRMRVRINGDGKGLSVGFGSSEENDRRYFQSHHGDVQPGEWTILRLPLSALMDDGDKKKIWNGVMLHKFQIVLWDKTEATLDVDWFEVGIDPDWIHHKEDK